MRPATNCYKKSPRGSRPACARAIPWPVSAATNIRIAIDDSGTGYSSLSTLKKFPVDTIKIDRAFIHEIASAADDKELTEEIIAVGRTLSLTVVAQGVETKEQADFLRRNACDEFQVFYFDKPVPADQITELLRAQSTSTEAHAGLLT